ATGRRGLRKDGWGAGRSFRSGAGFRLRAGLHGRAGLRSCASSGGRARFRRTYLRGLRHQRRFRLHRRLRMPWRRTLAERGLERRIVTFCPNPEIEQDGKRDENGRREADRQCPFRRVIHVERRSPLDGFARFANDDAIQLRRRFERLEGDRALIDGRTPFEVGLELIILLGVAHGPRSWITADTFAVAAVPEEPSAPRSLATA